MKVYFAVAEHRLPEMLLNEGFPDILCSYHYFKKKKELILEVQQKGANIFIDSGAFSAHNSGKNIHIDEYSEYLEFVKPNICVSLDVVGNPEKTLENWEYQKKNCSVNVLPTFHMKEPIEFLDYYMQKTDYIALGGMVGSGNKTPWLDKVFQYVNDKKPELKIHGFGMTTTDLIYKYPWTSFDSSSFMSGKKFGRVAFFNGKKMYTIRDKKFFASLEHKHPDILENKKKQRDLCDLQACKAYTDMVAYLTKFESNKRQKTQISLF